LPVTSHGVHDLHVHLLGAVPNASYLEIHGFGLESFVKEPLRLEDGDAITVDAEKREINVHLSDDELEARRSRWQRPAPYATRGVLAKYARLVSSASEGAVTDNNLN